MARGTRHWRWAAHALVVGLASLAAVLAWLGFQAIREWQASSIRLVQQRADEAASILTTAMSRDMQAVQQRVLSSADWAVDDPQSAYDTVASAFARYPYPDAFFAARGDAEAASLVFFVRSDRAPVWLPRGSALSPFPTTVVTDVAVARALLPAIAAATAAGRSFAAAEVEVGGRWYQVVTRLRYAGRFRDRLVGLLGVMIDLDWTRHAYFGELATQVARVDGMPPSTGFVVRDETGAVVSASRPAVQGAQRARNEMAMLFFDPLLVPLGSPPVVPRRVWTVEAAVAPDATLADAITGADRTALIAGAALVTLTLGLIMLVRLLSAMERVTALRTEFVSMVTHELKTPIANIRAMGDTLVSGRVRASEARQEYARLVVQEAKRLTRLVDNLLAVARITDVTDAYAFEALDIEPVVERTLDDFAHALQSAGFHLAVDIPPDLPLVRADRTATSLVLENIIDNAIRYSAADRSIAVSATHDAGTVTLTVADRGIGIPADDIGRVVQRFVRGKGQQSRGSGLGLAIADRVMRDHGGSLRIASGPGAGTTVSLTFQVAKVGA